MQIGSIPIDPPVALAPMEGVTDIVFRRLIGEIGGCGLFVTEFVSARNLVQGVPQAVRMATLDRKQRPTAIQVYGRDPDVLADAAQAAVALGADIVDLNMGCPSKAVCARSGGSALMREPDLAQRIVRAMRAVVSVPLTVKMRAGWDPASRNAPAIARMCEDEGADGLAVHWRTRTDRYGGERELDTIAEVVRRVAIPVFANGDIVDVASARDTMAQTGCAGVMIGRGAIRDPWVFRKVQAALAGRPPPVIDVFEKERVLLGYYDDIQPLFRTPHGRLGRMKQIAKYFTEGLPGGAALRQQVLRSQSVEEAYDRIGAFFEGLREAPDAERSVA